MNQELLFSGIGNYLKAEILYNAKICPFRNVSDIKDEEWKTIYNSIKEVTKGDYEIKVYSKKITSKGEKVLSKISKDNRRTWYVKEQCN